MVMARKPSESANRTVTAENTEPPARRIPLKMIDLLNSRAG